MISSNQMVGRRFLIEKALKAAMMVEGKGSDYAPLGLVQCVLQHVLEHWDELGDIEGKLKGGPNGQTEGVAGEVGSVDRGVHVTGGEVGSHDVRGGNQTAGQAGQGIALQASGRRRGHKHHVIIRFAEARMRAEFAHTTKQVG